MRAKFIIVFIFFSSLIFPSGTFHILQDGETLYSISRKYKIELQVLQTCNDIEDASRLKVGAKIFIPDSYKVKNGDTIYGIARALNVSAMELMDLNRLNEFSKIKAGDVLLVPKPLTSTQIASKNEEKTNNKKINGGEDALATKKATPSKEYKPLYDPRNYSKKTASPSLLWPVPAKKTFYLEGKVKGLVIESNKGEDVKSITSGKVISTGMQRGYGNVVFVQSKTRHIYVYGGLDRIDVKPNQMLSLNESIGKIGLEAFSGNARLYFLVYENNKPIDPAKAPRGF